MPTSKSACGRVGGIVRLVGKHVLVTGGTRGIGLAIAERCAAEGAAVVAVGRSAATAASEACWNVGQRCTVRLDVRDEAAVEALFTRLESAGAPPHGLGNNARAGGFQP